MALPKTPPGPAAIVTMSPPNAEAGRQLRHRGDRRHRVERSRRRVLGDDDGTQVGVGRGRRGRECRNERKRRHNRRHQAPRLQRHRPIELDLAATTLLRCAAPAVGMAETFHYLLRLDSSVLDRGRDARQHTISAQAAHGDESKHPLKSFKSPALACADSLVTL